MGEKFVDGQSRHRPFTMTASQSTHQTGGTVLGTSPEISVVNRECQSWAVSNVFVIGASNYPQNTVYNPTDTRGALIDWTADVLKDRYLKHPGPLM
jgi:gluconate 2-dehydrogenase alpha chain